MKKIISLIAIAVIAFASSCTTDNEDSFKAKVSTSDATDISYDYFTLHGSIEWSCEANCIGEAGFFVCNEANVSEKHNICTTSPVSLGNKFSQSDFTYEFKNAIGLDFLGVHVFEAGETCYYRAYIRAINSDGDQYIFGEEKSFTVPRK